MNPVRQALRLLKINAVLFKNGLDEVLLMTPLFASVRFLLILSPSYWINRKKEAPRGARIRKSLEELGPIFVKFGQILSTRKDLLPPDIALELSKLQDRVPPFPVELAREIIEAELGVAVDKIFSDFDNTPLASASIAQVHSAKLRSGKDVVVKVVRPGISKTIRQDVDLLHTFAELAEKYWSEGKRLRPREVVREFETNLFDELDLLREAANSSQLRRQFLKSNSLYVPEVYWDQCRTSVLVMERIHGIPINDIPALVAKGVDLKILAERGVEIFFTQVFANSFFHADMHPGNIFVDAADPKDPKYIAIDFGIMGSLEPNDQNYLAQNFLAFFNRDYRKVAELHVESGWVPSTTRVDEFESAIRTVCEPIFERPLKQISFGGLLLRLFQTARRFNMVVQPQLVLLQKTLLNIEGLGRQLYPDLDLWSTAKPFLEKWMSEQVGLRSISKKLKKNLPEISQWLPEIPLEIKHFMDNQHKLVTIREKELAEITQLSNQINTMQQKLFYFALASGMTVAAIILIIAKPYWINTIFGLPWPSWILLIGGASFLVRSWPKKLQRD